MISQGSSSSYLGVYVVVCSVGLLVRRMCTGSISGQSVVQLLIKCEFQIRNLRPYIIEPPTLNPEP